MHIAGQDEVMLSAALGNTCHLILKMSQILDLPLRHPMENRGSRSIVFDQVNPKLEKEREYVWKKSLTLFTYS